MILKKLDELEALITVPNVDKYPEQSLTAMKALNLIVELRGLVKKLDLHIVTNRTYKCSRCATEYIPVSGTVKAGCCIMPVDYRTSGICGGELIEVT